jgi:hypothetical protein
MKVQVKKLMGVLTLAIVLSMGTLAYAGGNLDGSLGAGDDETYAIPDSTLDYFFLQPNALRVCGLLTSSADPAFRMGIEFWPGGRLGLDICDSPNWQVTGISVNRPAKTGELNATHTGSGSCADSMQLHVTSATAGPTLHGTFCYDNDPAWCFPADVVRAACP